MYIASIAYCFQSDIYPGLLYFLSAGLVVISVICMYFAAETNNVKLKDTLDSEKEEQDIHLGDTDKELQFTKLWENEKVCDA